MKALVLWAEPHSANLGVRALGEGSEALLRRVWPDVQVSFQGYGPGDAPMRIGHAKSMLKQYVRPNSELLDWLRTFDLVVDTRGGDSFADIYGLKRLMDMSGIAELVKKAGVPLVLGPQTIGPFSSRRARLVGRRMLNMASCVMARDSTSAGYAAGLGRSVDAQTTDVVFALPRPVVPKNRDVMLNVSGLLWQPNPHVDPYRYRNIVRELIERLIRDGRSVSLLAHVLDTPIPDNDVPVIKELSTEFGSDVEMLIPNSLEDVRIAVASASIVLGSRMHACLNAISVGTPAIPLAYSRKFDPLLNDLQWHHTMDLRQPSLNVDRVMAAVEQPDLQTSLSRTADVAQQLLVVAEDALRAVAK